MIRAALAALVAASALVAGTRAQPLYADLILHKARFYTASDYMPQAYALAIRGSRIAAIGTDAEVFPLQGPSTRMVNLDGKTVVPGLADAHGHIVNFGASLERLNVAGVRSYDEIVEMVRARAATANPGEWILGRGWDQNLWADTAFPTHEKLDAAAPANPVYLTRVDGHAGLANAEAMRIASVTAATEAPAGGRIIKDDRGAPTGVFVDRAQALVTARIPPVTGEQLERQILLAEQQFRRLGLTMVHDAGASRNTIDTYKRLIDAGSVQTRIYAMARGSLDELAPLFTAGPLINYHDQHLTVRAIKIVADGALGSRGAALLEDYADEKGNRGLQTTPAAEMYEQTLAASKAGFQTCIHAIGDRANRDVLDLFERVQREVTGARVLRMRVEHAQILDARDIPRFAALGVIASMQPTHATSDMPWASRRLGAQRVAEGAYVWRKLMKSGAIVASGSDFPVESANPMLGLYAAITRQAVDGTPAGGWAPEERMNRVEALKSFTIHPAFAAHLDQQLGSLEPGKLADLVVLSRDIMNIPARDIPTVTVEKTMIGGRWVFE